MRLSEKCYLSAISFFSRHHPGRTLAIREVYVLMSSSSFALPPRAITPVERFLARRAYSRASQERVYGVVPRILFSVNRKSIESLKNPACAGLTPFYEQLSFPNTQNIA